MVPQALTPEERRTLGIAVPTAAATTLATGLVTLAIDEAKRAVAARRKQGEDEGTQA